MICSSRQKKKVDYSKPLLELLKGDGTLIVFIQEAEDGQSGTKIGGRPCNTCPFLLLGESRSLSLVVLIPQVLWLKSEYDGKIRQKGSFSHKSLWFCQRILVNWISMIYTLQYFDYFRWPPPLWGYHRDEVVPIEVKDRPSSLVAQLWQLRLRCEVIIAATASMFEIFCTTTTHFIFEDNTFKSFPNERWQKWTNSSRTKGLAGHWILILRELQRYAYFCNTSEKNQDPGRIFMHHEESQIVIQTQNSAGIPSQRFTLRLPPVVSLIEYTISLWHSSSMP